MTDKEQKAFDMLEAIRGHCPIDDCSGCAASYDGEQGPGCAVDDTMAILNPGWDR
jgi:hypothetical protein